MLCQFSEPNRIAYLIVVAIECGEIKIIDKKVIITTTNGTVWLTKHQIADLFEVFISKVGSNIVAILKAEVLEESEVCRRRANSKNSFITVYNLDMIIALSFRIRSRKA